MSNPRIREPSYTPRAAPIPLGHRVRTWVLYWVRPRLSTLHLTLAEGECYGEEHTCRAYPGWAALSPLPLQPPCSPLLVYKSHETRELLAVQWPVFNKTEVEMPSYCLFYSLVIRAFSWGTGAMGLGPFRQTEKSLKPSTLTARATCSIGTQLSCEKQHSHPVSQTALSDLLRVTERCGRVRDWTCISSSLMLPLSDYPALKLGIKWLNRFPPENLGTQGISSI